MTSERPFTFQGKVEHALKKLPAQKPTVFGTDHGEASREGVPKRMAGTLKPFELPVSGTKLFGPPERRLLPPN